MRLAAPNTLDEYAFDLARVVARTSLLPNPEVVRACPSPIFPSIRANRALGSRGTIATVGAERLMLDDNTTPRWALLVAHGFGPSLPSKSRGWSLAHVWSRAQCPASYTHLANLALVPAPLSTLTDGTSPVASYIRYHAYSTYGWHPHDEEAPREPPAFNEVDWNYMTYSGSPQSNLSRFMKTTSNAWAVGMRDLMGA